MDTVLQFITDYYGIWHDTALKLFDPKALWEQFLVRRAGTIGIFYWQNVFIYVVVGLLFFVWSRRGSRFSLKEAFQSLVPADMKSPAVKVDLQFFLYDLLGLRNIAITTISLMLCAPLFTRLVRALEPWRLPGLSQLSAWAMQLGDVPRSGLGFALALLGGEFFFYWYHRAAHQWPLLWQFHKVHHYSREMNPMVAIRVHDLDEALHIQGMFMASIFSVGLIFPGGLGTADFDDSTFWIVILYQTLLRISGRFAHSHIPISLGPVLDRVINTAVVHQMHHSRDIIDVNFGQNLSIWDTVFGTLRLPAPGEKINFGISEFGDEHYRSLLHCQIEPYVEAYKLLFGKKKVRQGSTGAVAGALAPPQE